MDRTDIRECTAATMALYGRKNGKKRLLFGDFIAF
jgi:hypothetical protein